MKNLVIPVLLIVLVSFIGVGCSNDSVEKSPGKYVVFLDKVCFSEKDWHRSTLGGELNIVLTVYQNGNPVWEQVLSGKRGTRKMPSDCFFVLDHKALSNYQITLKEQAIIADAWIYTWPASPTSKWVFDRKISSGDNSWLKFKSVKKE